MTPHLDKGSFTHLGCEYDLNILLENVAGRQTVEVPVSELIWIFKYDTNVDSVKTNVDRSKPILIHEDPTSGKLVTIDGLHRLTLAAQLGDYVIQSIFVSDDDLKDAAYKNSV
jgi:hypothetical protein